MNEIWFTNTCKQTQKRVEVRASELVILTRENTHKSLNKQPRSILHSQRAQGSWRQLPTDLLPLFKGILLDNSTSSSSSKVKVSVPLLGFTPSSSPQRWGTLGSLSNDDDDGNEN